MLKHRLGPLKQKVRLYTIKGCLFNRFDESDVLVLASSPRSGSTLLAQVLASIPKSCVLFEPIHPDQVLEAKAAGFSRRNYVPVGQSWPEGEAFLRDVFRGRMVNEWMTRELTVREAFHARKLIVKFVRANRLIPWMSQRFRIPPPLVLLRHPCAVIASHMRSGWTLDARPESPSFLEEFPAFQEALARTEQPEEFLAAYWALDQIPVLLYPQPRPWSLMTYEELVGCSESAIRKCLQAWNVDIDMNDALVNMKQPSSVVNPAGISGLSGWKRQLSESQISNILRTVNAFGLSFYDRAEEPHLDVLYGEGLPESIRRAGLGSEAPVRESGPAAYHPIAGGH